MTEPVQNKGRGRRSLAGNSIRASAVKAQVPLGRLRKAIKLGQVEVIEFGGVPLLTNAECQRIREIYHGKTDVAE